MIKENFVKRLCCCFYFFAMIFLFVPSIEAQSVEPTQTPRIIYVVVTATPEPAAIAPTEAPAGTGNEIILKNNSYAEGTTDSSVSLKNDTSEGVDAIVQKVLATLTAASANSNASAQNTNSNAVQSTDSGQCLVTQTDGSSCTMGLEIVSEPNYYPKASLTYGDVIYKEWVVRNTGTCTWTPDYYFVFNSGWQLGNTRFSMNRTTKPGETLTVRLGLTMLLGVGKDYYSTYILESPTGVQCGTITSYFDVNPTPYSYATTKPEPPKTWCKDNYCGNWDWDWWDRECENCQPAPKPGPRPPFRW